MNNYDWINGHKDYFVLFLIIMILYLTTIYRLNMLKIISLNNNALVNFGAFCTQLSLYLLLAYQRCKNPTAEPIIDNSHNRFHMADLQPLAPPEGVDRYLRHRKPSVRESTLQNAKSRLSYFLEWCENEEIENLNDLTGRLIADFVAWRRSQVSPITMQKQVSTIRQACRFWEDIEAVPDGLSEKVHAPELPDGAESRDVHLDGDRARSILESLDRYEYASRDHVLMLLLWETGMRRGAVRSLDLQDLRPDDYAIVLEHRPEKDTKLKNGQSGERWVSLDPSSFGVIEEYIETHRIEKTDDHGRKPLITTDRGRPSADTIYTWVNKITHPCRYGPCPHDRDTETCEALGKYPSRCPSARSPHAVRRGHITAYLNAETPPEVVSERCDVSLDVLYEHYDARTALEKMEVRRQQLPEFDEV